MGNRPWWLAVLACLLLVAGCNEAAPVRDPATAASPASTPSTPVTPITPGTLDGASPPYRVLFVGDSLAEGYYASRLGADFVEQLLTGWRARGDVMDIRASRSGWRTWRISRLVESVSGGLDLAVLEAGANDVGHTSPREFKRDYRLLLERVEAGSSHVTVLCLGPWGAPRRAAPYNRVVRSLCDRPGMGYAPLSDLYAERGTRGPAGTRTFLGKRDAYHPNNTGHAAIARRVRQLLVDIGYAATTD